MRLGKVSGEILGAAIEIHRCLGPGLLESTYEECLNHELRRLGHAVRRQTLVPLRYKDLEIEQAFRVDLVVGESVVIEVKTVESILPVHRAQLLTYLRLGGFPVGLLINFHVAVLRNGVVRMVN